MKRAVFLLFGFSLIAATSTQRVAADVILQNTSGTAGTATEFFGEMFKTPNGGPYTNISFNFYSDVPATTPSAGGVAYLFTQEYLGTPSGLSTALPNLVAATTAVNGVYTFDPSVTLQSNTAYYLYENAPITTSGGGSVTDTAAYFAADQNSNFTTVVVPGTTALQSSNFLLTGTAAVPEPSSVALCGIAFVVGLGYTQARRKRLGIA